MVALDTIYVLIQVNGWPDGRYMQQSSLKKKNWLNFSIRLFNTPKNIEILWAPYLDLVTNLTPKLRRNTTFLIKQTRVFIILVHTCHTSIPWNTIADNFLFDKKSNRISIDTYTYMNR